MQAGGPLFVFTRIDLAARVSPVEFRLRGLHPCSSAGATRTNGCPDDDGNQNRRRDAHHRGPPPRGSLTPVPPTMHRHLLYPEIRRNIPSFTSLNLDIGHHSEVLVIENVAVNNRLSSEVLEGNTKRDRLSHRDVHRVAPPGIKRSAAAPTDHLEWPNMEMERVIHH